MSEENTTPSAPTESAPDATQAAQPVEQTPDASQAAAPVENQGQDAGTEVPGTPVNDVNVEKAETESDPENDPSNPDHASGPEDSNS